jgi:hypothetical protein
MNYSRIIRECFKLGHNGIPNENFAKVMVPKYCLKLEFLHSEKNM